MSSEILLASQQNPNIPISSLFIRKELVGKGAYGGVYKGVHTPTGLVVALKVIDLDTADDDISEIRKEVALLSEMREANKHNITLYHGCYLNGTELWIAMDFASGGSIRTLMKSGPIEEKYIVLIVREVLVALSYLHRQGIIHRDIKAANILLTQAGKILLCDFGVAAHLQTNSNKRSTFIGTPLWMAPEVITDGKSYDTKADIWSLGVTLYEIATGNPPYFGMEPLRACALIPRSAPARLDASGNFSLPMKEFLGLCLQTDPSNRPTADELSKSKWIKSVTKVSMNLLRELIVRYLGWIGTGGVRTSLLIDGDTIIAREDTFEQPEDEIWDFDDDIPFEPLGDEPARSQEQLAILNNPTRRPPKPANGNNLLSSSTRSHPLQRLFLDSNGSSSPASSLSSSTSSYASMLSSFSNAANLNSMDTLRPTISIPSFEEMDEMIEAQSSSSTAVRNQNGSGDSNRGFGYGGASSSSGFGGAGSVSSSGGFDASMRFMDLPSETLAPSSLPWNPIPPQPLFQQFQQLSTSQLQYSPRLASMPLQPPPRFRNNDSPPGSPNSLFGFEGLSTSSSSSDLRDERTFIPRGGNSNGVASRDRSATFGNSEYPPLGRGIPALAKTPAAPLISTPPPPTTVTPRQHSNNSSLSYTTTNLPFSHRATPSNTSSTDSGAPLTSSITLDNSPGTPTGLDSARFGTTVRGGGSEQRLRLKTSGDHVPSEDVNRPFRNRTASDARSRIGLNGNVFDNNGNNAGVGAGNSGGNRTRTGSDARMQLKHGTKLQISTSNFPPTPNGPNTVTQTSMYSLPSSSSTSSISTPTATSLSSSTSGIRPSLTPLSLANSITPSYTSPAEFTASPITSLSPPYSSPIVTPSAQAIPRELFFPSPPRSIKPVSSIPFPSLLPSRSLPSSKGSSMDDWTAGPPIRSLDYGNLKTTQDVHEELERTIEELGKWLGVVERGLDKIVGTRPGEKSTLV